MTIISLMHALVEEGYVQKDERINAFGLSAFLGMPDENPQPVCLEPVIPHMRDLAQITGNSVYLIVRKDADSLCMHREFGSYPIQINTLAVNQRQPLGIGAAGLSLLSAYDDELIEEILERNRQRLGMYGGMTLSVMRKLIKNTRTRGVSLVGNYAVKGVTGIGVALLERNQPFAGLSICSSEARMSGIGHKKIYSLLMDVAKAINGRCLSG